MQLEIGKIYEGKVTGITSFGAFVEISPGLTGMVHISEVALNYVKDIASCISIAQSVKVKVLKIGEDGKVSLSIKKAFENIEDKNYKNNAQQPKKYNNTNNKYENRFSKFSKSVNLTPSFEDMLAKFKQTSDEKLCDLKRGMDSKRGSYAKRNNSK